MGTKINKGQMTTGIVVGVICFLILVIPVGLVGLLFFGMTEGSQTFQNYAAFFGIVFWQAVISGFLGLSVAKKSVKLIVLSSLVVALTISGMVAIPLLINS